MDKDFFLVNNESGYKCSEKWLKNNQYDFYLEITNNCISTEIPFIEKLYLFLNQLTERPKCYNCENNVKFLGTLRKGYSRYCSLSCLNKSEEHKSKIVTGCLNKHGCVSYNQVSEVKLNKIRSSKKRFGCNNPMQSEVIKDKQKISLLNSHGVTNPIFIPDVINKRKSGVVEGSEFNIKRMLNRLDNNYIKFISHDNNKNLKLFCLSCNNEFTISSNLLTSRLANNTTICTKCNKVKSYSMVQRSVEEYLLSLNVLFETKNRKILNGKELDIFIPESNLAIEINGLFWHSNKFKNKYYHLNKTNQCESQGIQLIHIFEDEWLFDQDKIKGIINNKLNKIKPDLEMKCFDRRFNSALEFKLNQIIGTTEPISYEIIGNKRIKIIDEQSNTDNFIIYDCGNLIIG